MAYTRLFSKNTISAGVLSLLLFLCSCRSTSNLHGIREEIVPTKKSVFVGELLSIFPGLLWHGLGHRYAGDKEKAQEMELLEAYSVLGAGAGLGLVTAGQNNDNLKSLQITGYAIGGFSGIAFLGSWLYDIIYTPSAVNRYNAGLNTEKE